jgi:hypothetical protein
LVNFVIPSEKNNYKPYLLRNGALAVYTVFLLLFNTLSGFVGVSKVQASSITPSNIIELTNADRTKYGLNTLKSNSKLSSAALAKANNMFKLQYWNHFGPNGESPWDFIHDSGYTYVYAGENLAKGFKTAQGVEEAWLASPTHRANLLSGNYKEIGVAVVSGKLLGEDILLVVQMFGNQTNNVVASPKPNVDVKQTESGQTMSITITNPKDGDVLNTPEVDLSGTATNKSDNYTVNVYEGSKTLGGFETNGNSWSWDKKSDWSEGSHEVTVKVKDIKGATDSTRFTIDSRGPQLIDFKAESKGFNWDISGKIDDVDGTLNIVSGDFNQSYVVSSDGLFAGQFPNSQVNGDIMLITSDKLGNVTQKDITSYFKTETKGNVLGTFLGTVSSVVSNKDVINGAFLGFILILLLIEVVTYWRKHLLAKKGINLFTIGFWWLLLAVGVVSGFAGNIL